MILESQVVALVFLLALSAFFSGAELAFLSISSVKMHSLLEKGAVGAASLARLREKRRRVVISLLIYNNIVNVSASAIATSICISLFGEEGVGIAVGAMTFLILTFGEITPKSIAATYSERIALLAAPVVEVLYYISLPLVTLFEFINWIIPGIYSRPTGVERFTEEDVRSAVKLGAAHKGITEEEKKLIENVLAFNDKLVGSAMTPKGSVVTLPADLPVADAHRRAIASKYSRFPVVDRKGRVVGTLSVKIIGKALYEHPDWPLEKIAWPPVRLKIDDKASEAFSTLQKLGRNIAVVEDAKGNFAGVVTLEDLLEELVGELK